MQVYYDRDADLGVLKGKKVAVLGYEAKVMHMQIICATRELMSSWV